MHHPVCLVETVEKDEVQTTTMAIFRFFRIGTKRVELKCFAFIRNEKDASHVRQLIAIYYISSDFKVSNLSIL